MTTNETELAQVALEANYRVKEYQERRGIKGVIEWWTTIKADRARKGITLHVTCSEDYDEVIINGEIYIQEQLSKLT